MITRKKVKEWYNAHEEGVLTAVGFVVASAAVVTVGAIIVVSVKSIATEQKNFNAGLENYNTWADSVNQWLVETQSQGKDVYLLLGGEYLVIPSDAAREVVVK